MRNVTYSWARKPEEIGLDIYYKVKQVGAMRRDGTKNNSIDRLRLSQSSKSQPSRLCSPTC